MKEKTRKRIVRACQGGLVLCILGMLGMIVLGTFIEWDEDNKATCKAVCKEAGYDTSSVRASVMEWTFGCSCYSHARIKP